MRSVKLIFTFVITLIISLSCEDNPVLTSAELKQENPDKEEEKEEEPIAEPIDWCKQSPCWDANIFTCRDSAMIANFTRDKDWTGGDATYSIPLPGDRIMWLFGDSFIDQVNANRSRPSFRLINNCLMIQQGNEFTTVHGGTAQAPKAFAAPSDASSWYWPGHGVSDEDTLYLFMHAFGSSGNGGFDFFRTGIDLLKIDPYTFEIFENNRLIDGNGISYGAHVMQQEDSVYIYGVLAQNSNKYLYVAKADFRFRQPWKYLSGGKWVTEAALATSVFSGVSEQFTVFEYEGKYYLLTQNHILGSQIYIYSSDSPIGPWENKRIIYCTPETGGNIITYNAYAHTMFTSNGKLLVSYNINSLNFSDLLKDADNYRPYFITVENWQD